MKVTVAAAATLVLTVPTTLATGVIVLGLDDGDAVSLGFAVGVAVGAVAYSSVFVGLSAFTSRALLIGLGYVFVWETFVTNIFSGTSIFSIRQYTLGIADVISTAPARYLDAELGGATAVIAAALVIVASFALGVRFLERFEIGERL